MMKYSVLSKYRSELMGAALAWIMLYHAWQLDIPGLNFIREWGYGGVDIFIVLSAVGLTASLSRRPQSYGTFISRRLWRILPAYYLVVIPYTLFQIGRGTAPASALFWNTTLLGYYFNVPGAFNWYVSAILLFYLLTPPLFRLLKRSGHRELLTLGLVALGLLLVRLELLSPTWERLDVLFRLPVYVLGLLMGFYVLEDRPLTGRSVLFWACCTAVGTGLYPPLSRYFLTRNFYLPLCHIFLLIAVPLCLVLCLLFEKLPLGLLRAPLRLLGDCSLEIYLLNASVFLEFDLLRQLLHMTDHPRLYYVVAIPLNILLGIALHYAIEGVRTWWRGRKRAALGE